MRRRILRSTTGRAEATVCVVRDLAALEREREPWA